MWFTPPPLKIFGYCLTVPSLLCQPSLPSLPQRGPAVTCMDRTVSPDPTPEEQLWRIFLNIILKILNRYHFSKYPIKIWWVFYKFNTRLKIHKCDSIAHQKATIKSETFISTFRHYKLSPSGIILTIKREQNVKIIHGKLSNS